MQKNVAKHLVRLKTALSDDPVLLSQDNGHEFVMQTDSSDRGVGAVLCEVNENMEEQPIA